MPFPEPFSFKKTIFLKQNTNIFKIIYCIIEQKGSHADSQYISPVLGYTKCQGVDSIKEKIILTKNSSANNIPQIYITKNVYTVKIFKLELFTFEAVP